MHLAVKFTTWENLFLLLVCIVLVSYANDYLVLIEFFFVFFKIQYIFLKVDVHEVSFLLKGLWHNHKIVYGVTVLM